MATLAVRIIEHLRSAWGPLEDGEIADALGVSRRAVNDACRRLERDGVVRRQEVPGGKIVNTTRSDPSAPQARQPESRGSAVAPARITQDEMKAAIVDHLAAVGFDAGDDLHRTRGPRIDAVGPSGRIVIEVMGAVPAGRGQFRYFVDALVELIQRMSDAEATYGLALPDHPQCRDFAARLPALVRDRLRLRMYFVSRDAEGAFAVEDT